MLCLFWGGRGGGVPSLESPLLKHEIHFCLTKHFLFIFPWCCCFRVRLLKVGRVLMLWTVARVVWSLSALTAVLEYQRLVGISTSFREQVKQDVRLVIIHLLVHRESEPGWHSIPGDRSLFGNPFSIIKC